MPIPPPSYGLTIFEGDPGAPTEQVFNQGIPSTNTDKDSLSIVLFSPNLQLIQSLDNSQSDATSTYSTSISRGFSFSTSQQISISTKVGVSIEIVTVEQTITFALSFTEQWTETKTLTYSFSCPPGKKAFVYQGTLVSKLMAFDAENGKYSWMSAPSTALTDLVVTTRSPIGSAPSNSVSIRS